MFRDMLLGYARVSADEQTASLQLYALTLAGCERTFSESALGAKEDRPVLAHVLNHLHAGDTLIAWRLDRLRRLLSHLIEIVQRLEKDGVAFRSLAEGINTGTTIGRVIFHLFGALAQFERDLIRERAQAGLAAGRARGRKGGQPPKLSAEKIRIARRLLNDPESTVSEVARTLGVHRFTLHKALQERGAEKSDEEVGRGLVHAG